MFGQLQAEQELQSQLQDLEQRFAWLMARGTLTWSLSTGYGRAIQGTINDLLALSLSCSRYYTPLLKLINLSTTVLTYNPLVLSSAFQSTCESCHNVMPSTTPSLLTAAACLQELTKDVNMGALENDQEEEIESMQAAEAVATQTSEIKESRSVKNKRAKLDMCEASLKTASAQVVVANTLVEYARSVRVLCMRNY